MSVPTDQPEKFSVEKYEPPAPPPVGARNDSILLTPAVRMATFGRIAAAIGRRRASSPLSALRQLERAPTIEADPGAFALEDAAAVTFVIRGDAARRRALEDDLPVLDPSLAAPGWPLMFDVYDPSGATVTRTSEVRRPVNCPLPPSGVPSHSPARLARSFAFARAAAGGEGELVAAADALHRARKPETAARCQVQYRLAPRADTPHARQGARLREAHRRQDHSADDQTGHEDEVRHGKEYRQKGEEPRNAQRHTGPAGSESGDFRCRTTATPDVAGAPKADSVTGTSVVSPPASMTPDWPVA